MVVTIRGRGAMMEIDEEEVVAEEEEVEEVVVEAEEAEAITIGITETVEDMGTEEVYCAVFAILYD